MSVSVSVVSDIHELERYQSEWSALLGRSTMDNPTVTPTWLLAWWAVFGAVGSRSLRVGMFRADGRLIGLAPVCTRRVWYPPGIPFRRVEFLGSGEAEADEVCSDYLSVIAERGWEERVAAAFSQAISQGAFGECDEVVLPAMDAENPMAKALSASFQERGFYTEASPCSECPYIPLPDSWERYIAALSGPRRYFLRRSLRDFESFSKGRHGFERVASRADLERGMGILRSLHDERWGAERSLGAFGSSRFLRFHESILGELFDSGALDLCWLSVENTAIAVLYNIVHDRKVYFYQSGRKLDLPKGIRPGIVLHAYAIRRAIECGLREYDFLAGASRYKLDLALATRPLIRLRAARPSMVEGARRIVQPGLERARALKQGIRLRVRGHARPVPASGAAS